MKIIICQDIQEWAKTTADIFQDAMQVENPNFILATGGTPVPMYEELVRRHKEEGLSFKNLSSYNLDEYVGLEASAPQSYRRFMQENLFDHVDIIPENTHLPNGMAADPEAECVRYEKAFREAGDIQLAVLGIGHTGHIGFNEPGTPFDSQTHIAELEEATLQANARFFDGDISRVPTKAMTMGLSTIMCAKKILLLITGAGKAEIAKKALHGPVDVQISATILQNHPDVVVVLDKEAAALL